MSFNYTSTGGALPKTYSIESGALPTGISLNTSTAALTGTFTTEGTFNWVVKVVDANGMETTLPDTCIVSAAPFFLRGVAWNKVSKKLTVWQGDTDAVTATIDVPIFGTPNSPSGIRSDGTRAYVISGGNIPDTGGELFEVNLTNNTAALLLTLPVLDTSTFALTRNGAFAYVTSTATDTVLKVDIAAAAVNTSVTVADPTICRLSHDEQFLYIGGGSPTLKIRKLSTSSMTVVASSPNDSIIVCGGISVSADDTKLYVTGQHTNDFDLTAFNTSNMSVAATANYTPSSPLDVLADDANTYVYMLRSNGVGGTQLTKIDATSLAVVSNVDVSAGAILSSSSRMAWSYDYTRIFVSDPVGATSTDNVVVVDPVSMTTLTPILANDEPCSAAASGTATVLGYNGVALAIPDNNGFVSSNIVISGETPANQTNLAITMNLTHSYRGDLEIIIDKPDGGSVTLVSPDENDNLRNFVRSFALGPSALLVNGTWTLRIRDTVAADVGTLNYWKVIKTSA